MRIWGRHNSTCNSLEFSQYLLSHTLYIGYLGYSYCVMNHAYTETFAQVSGYSLRNRSLGSTRMPLIKALDSTLPGCFPESKVRGLPIWPHPDPVSSFTGLSRDTGLFAASRPDPVHSVCARACQQGRVRPLSQGSFLFSF